MLPPAVNAQQLIADTGPDSFERALEQASAGTGKAVILQKLSDYWLYKDSAKAMEYALRILDLHGQDKSGLIPGIGHYQVGGVYMEHHNLDSAEEHHLLALRLLRHEHSRQARQYLAKTWHDHGAVYQRRGDEQKFLDMLLNKAIPILESIHDTLRLGMDYNSVGLIFRNNKQWDKAQEYYEKAIDILEHYPQHEILAEAHLNASKNLMYMEDDSPEQVRKIQGHLDRASQLLSPNPESPARVHYYTCNGLFYQYYKEEPDKALENYDKGMALARKLNEQYLESELVNRKFYVYYDQGQYGLAREMANRQYEMASRFSTGTNLRIALRHLIDVEEKSGNIRKAYELLNQHVALSDSLKENETQIRIHELEKKYQHEKKENEILRLKNESSLQELKLQRARFWGYLAGGIALLLGGGLLAGFKIYRNKQQIARQKEQLHRQEMEQLKQEQRLSNFSAMLEGQEQERKRVAGELHDGLGGYLSGIKIRLSHALMENKEREQLPSVLSQLDDSITELRRIARNLMPETLLRYDLVTALKEFCRGMEGGPAKIAFQAYGVGDDDMPQTTRMMFYRIVQELLTNAVKHANASRILVQLIQNGSKLSLTVEDNGSGFDPDSKIHGAGLGLSTVKSRVEYLKGHLELLSEHGTGTTVNIDIDPGAVSGHPVTAYAEA